MPAGFGLSEFESKVIAMKKPLAVLLRIAAVALGTYYVYGAFYLVWNSDFDPWTRLGYFVAAIGQLGIGVILAGIGIGAWRIVINAKAR